MDVKKLTEEPSVRVRGLLASKIAMDYRTGGFSVKEADIATDIFRMLLKDIEIQIRQAVAEQLAYCPNAPHDIIVRLAGDEPEVAVHVLEHSSVLTEDDLISLVHSSCEIIKLCAIARRSHIPERLSGCLIDTHNTIVLQNLFQNKGAKLTERQLIEAWDMISSSPSLLHSLVTHGGLPLVIAEKLYHIVADDLKRQLSANYPVNAVQLKKAFSDVQEWEILGLSPVLSGGNPEDNAQIESLVDELYLHSRLTHSLLIRALCAGNLNVFEAGIARLAGVPRVNARILLMDLGGMGLEAIYTAAGMPAGFFDAVKILLRLSLEETDFGHVRPADFRKRIIDRIYVSQYNHTVDNMEYLLSIIGGRIAAGAHAH